MLKAKHAGRYTELALLFTRYGRKDFTLQTRPGEVPSAAPEDAGLAPDVVARARAFAATLKS